MATIADRKVAPDGRPIAPRRKTFTLAAIRVGLTDHRAHILDISRSGAKVHCTTALPSAGEIWLRHGDLAVPARVVWSDEGRHGLHFAHPISDAQVDAVGV